MKRFFLQTIPLMLLCAGSVAAQVSATVPTDPMKSDVSASLPDIQPLQGIRDAVEQFVLSQQADLEKVEVTVKELDSRLRLAYCHDALQSNWSPGSRSLGRVTVQVRCASPRPWRVHVQATVTKEGTVWTLTRGVRRGDVLAMDLLTQEQVTLGAGNNKLTTSRHPVVDIEPWLGFEFTQRVNGGKVLNEQMLKPARLINKGDTVVIRHRSRGLELLTRGIAMSDAGGRQQTQVRNTSSGKVVDVVVAAPGIVEILQ